MINLGCFVDIGQHLDIGISPEGGGATPQQGVTMNAILNSIPADLHRAAADAVPQLVSRAAAYVLDGMGPDEALRAAADDWMALLDEMAACETDRAKAVRKGVLDDVYAAARG